MSRVAKFGIWIGAAALIGVGIWFRVTSPTSLPLIDADEAFFGVQANRVLDGKLPAFETYTKNLVSPINAGLQIPLIAAFGPRWWILRAPTIASGVLAIFFSAWMLRKPLDRATALLSAVLIAVFPAAIVASRIGYDAHLTPFLSVLVLGFALQGRGIACCLAWLAALSAHPTNLFLLPIAMPVYLVRVWERTETDPRRRVREIAFAVLIPGSIAAVMGFLKMRAPVYVHLQATAGSTATIGAFIARLGRIMLGVNQIEPK